MIRKIALAAVCTIGLTAPALAGSIVIEEAWAESEVVNGTAGADLFLRVTNKDAAADRIYAVKTAIARRVYLEAASEDEEEQGISEKTVTILVPAGATTEFGEDAAHIELRDLPKELVIGETFSATVFFENAGPVKVNVVVREEDDDDDDDAKG